MTSALHQVVVSKWAVSNCMSTHLKPEKCPLEKVMETDIFWVVFLLFTYDPVTVGITFCKLYFRYFVSNCL